jgi:hypothetical protein
MFIPPWYQPPIVQTILEPLTKLPYVKLQYLTYVKDIDLDSHDPSLRLTIKARACKGAGQEWSLGVTFHAPKSVGGCEGMRNKDYTYIQQELD